MDLGKDPGGQARSRKEKALPVRMATLASPNPIGISGQGDALVTLNWAFAHLSLLPNNATVQYTSNLDYMNSSYPPLAWLPECTAVPK